MRKSINRERTPSLRGALIVRAQRGKLTAQGWPRKRKGPRHATNVYWSEWLQQADILAKYAPDSIQLSAREAAAGTAQMPRDLIISSMRGRLWYIEWEDGHRSYPLAAARDISDSLDILSQYKGTLLVRGADLWIPVPLPDHKTVLTWNVATGLPEWDDATGASSNYSAPLAASFPVIIGTPAPTLVQASPGPLVLGRTPAAAGTFLGAALRTLSTAPRTYTFGLRHVAELVTNNKWGLVLRDSVTGRLVAFNYVMVTPTSTPRLQVDYWTSPTVWTSTPVFRILTHQNTLFLRVLDDGTNFVFSVAGDDANFQTVATLSRTAWLAVPNQLGFNIASGALENLGSTLAAFHYHDE